MVLTRIRGELIRFPTKDGYELQGFLSGPKRAKRCIIHVHGMRGNFYGGKIHQALLGAANRQAFSVFTINTRGHDPVSWLYSRSKKPALSGTYFERFESCVEDIHGAIGALKKLGFREFVLSGHSTGCQKVTYYQYKKKESSVKGIVLLAPADDYSVDKRHFGKRFGAIVKMCKKLARERKGNMQVKGIPFDFSAKRFLSVADPGNAEARTFNYDGPMNEFRSIRKPILAVFSAKEEYKTKPIPKYMKILEGKSRSARFTPLIIKGRGGHSFRGRENEIAKLVIDYARSL